MKTRIEYRDLLLMGATPEQLAIYSDTDPLEIFEHTDGTYSMRGIIEADDLPAIEVLEYLDTLGEEEAE